MSPISLRTPATAGQLVVGGHIMPYEANAIVRVPPVLVDAALAAGFLALDAPVDAVAPATEAAPISGPDYHDLFAVFEALIAENNPAAFSTTGMPRVEAVAARAGYKVARTDIIEAWKAFRAQ